MYLLLSLVWASDHFDGPASTRDPARDITDVFTWVTERDGRSKLALVMTFHPYASSDAVFSPDYSYELNLRRAQIDGVGDTSHITYGSEFLLSCHVTQDLHHLRCRIAPVGKHCEDCVRVITTPLDAPQGASVPGVRLFAGLRGDPFFIDTTRVTAARPRSGPRTDHAALDVVDNALIKGDVLALVLELDVVDVLGHDALYGISGRISYRATLTEVPRVRRLAQ